MFFSKKVVALMAITASFAHGYQVQPTPSSNKVDRRAMLKQAGVTGAAFLAIASGVVNPPPSFAMDSNMSRMNTISHDMKTNRLDKNSRATNQFRNQKSIGSRSLAQVTQWPESQYLVPFSEMEKSLDFLQREISSSRGEEGIKTGNRMVENFYKNRNVYKTVASNYAKNIQFVDPTDTRARQDKKFFNDAADETVKAMEDVGTGLKQLAMKRANKVTPDVMASLNRAKNGVQAILNTVPREDVDQARTFARTVAKADTKGFGFLEGDQMKFMAKTGKDSYRNMKQDNTLGFNARIGNDNRFDREGYNF